MPLIAIMQCVRMTNSCGQRKRKEQVIQERKGDSIHWSPLGHSTWDLRGYEKKKILASLNDYIYIYIHLFLTLLSPDLPVNR